MSSRPLALSTLVFTPSFRTCIFGLGFLSLVFTSILVNSRVSSEWEDHDLIFVRSIRFIYYCMYSFSGSRTPNNSQKTIKPSFRQFRQPLAQHYTRWCWRFFVIGSSRIKCRKRQKYFKMLTSAKFVNNCSCRLFLWAPTSSCILPGLYFIVDYCRNKMLPQAWLIGSVFISFQVTIGVCLDSLVTLFWGRITGESLIFKS